MDDTPDLRDQLRSLRIPREQRPAAAAGARATRSPTVLVLLLLVLGMAGYIAWTRWGERLPGLSPASQPASVRLVKVEARLTAETTPTLTATGKIVSDHHVDVATKVSGQVVALFFEQGDWVERGQLLARIEDVLPRARRDEAIANRAKARAAFEYQKVNFERVQDLSQSGQASDIELAEAHRAYDEALALVAAADAELAYADKVLSDCQVDAPIAGVMLERNVEVGDFVAAEGGRGAMANAQVGSIADMSKLRVEVDVNELDVGRLQPGMPCVVVPDSSKDRRYRGHVLWLDPSANYAKATVQVKVRIEKPDEYLRIEGAAQVQFLAAEPQAATSPGAGLWIPCSAVLRNADGGARVFVARAGRFIAVPVRLGARERDSVEVLSGLVDGQEVAAEGVDRLTDGQPVPR
jgi:RND family efflux transporter MFP subunit